ncbi:MAG TPA: SDR family oxidoreductase [Bryobacteraceae bacterium]|nr:SDR family oxidoreductase [Bryobacteraceae bacterium]
MITLDLNGRVAVVTGAGRGIGQALALKLAEAGAAVAINDLEQQATAETVDAITSAGGRALACPGDVTAPEFPATLIRRTVETFAGLDIVVNNAGYTWDTVIQKTTDAQFQAMLDIHLTAPFRILRAASEFIRPAAKAEATQGERRMRKVVNITSIAGTDGNAGQIGYSSGKAGVIGMTRTMAKEWGRYNVNVNCVGFGLIETRLIQPVGAEGASIEIKGERIGVGVQQRFLDAIKAECPLGRLGTPEEAANAVLFFCSPLSDYVTGEVLICSGGLHF